MVSVLLSLLNSGVLALLTTGLGNAKASLLRQIVAGPRLRDAEAGLDLCYVTDYIVATSGPSSTYPKRAYRNPTDALVKFLDEKHKSDWAIWEFRAEGTGYPDSEVYGRIHHYPWPDHHPPPFALIPNLMGSMRNWLKDPQATNRVVVVHCKAGKGRSGTAACAYLISEEGWSVEDALKRFTERRMRQGFGAGVSIPSQLRYVNYVDQWTKNGKLYAERQIEILEVHIWGMKDGLKVAIEGFVDEGKTIKTFHLFSEEETIIINGTARSTNAFAELAAQDKEECLDKNSSSSPLEGTPNGRDMSDSEVASPSSPKPSAEGDSEYNAVMLRPSTRVILPTNDVNIDIERRNKAAYGWAMVTAVGHVWFNAFFEGQDPENGGQSADDGIFEINWDAMDGIKGSSRKGIRALDRIAVVWRAVDTIGEDATRIITEPPEGANAPDVKAADWKGTNPDHSNFGGLLGLRTGTPVMGQISNPSATGSAETRLRQNKEAGDQRASAQTHGLDGEAHMERSEQRLQPPATGSESKFDAAQARPGMALGTTAMIRRESQALNGVGDSGLTSIAGIVSGLKPVSTEDLPDGKPEDDMKTSHAYMPGQLKRL